MEVEVGCEPFDRSGKDSSASEEGGALDKAGGNTNAHEFVGVEGEETNIGNATRATSQGAKLFLQDSEGAVAVVAPEHHDADESGGFPRTEAPVSEGD